MTDTRINPPPEATRREIEARYVRVRLVELHDKPPDPTFDEGHLRDIHRHIFQDLPRKGIADHHPGEYRAPTGEGADWVKHRQLETVSASLIVPYSPMDGSARNDLTRTLSTLDIYGLRAMDRDHLASELARTYARLDYLHPFSEGNSRTLRFFFSQLAEECEHQLDWQRLAGTPQQRDQLYIARDVAVIRQALPHVRGERTLKLATATLDRLEGNPTLEQLFIRSLRPVRALAFEQLSPAAAAYRHPELRDTYAGIDQAQRRFHETYQPGPDALARFTTLIRDAIQKGLDRGQLISARDIELPPSALRTVHHQDRER